MWSRRDDRQLRQQLVPLILGDLDALPAYVAAAPARQRVAIDEVLLDHHQRTSGRPSPALLAALRHGPAVARARQVIARRRGRGRCEAAELLGAVRDTASFPALVSHLDDPDPELREACARALGRLGDPGAAPHLLDAVEHPELGIGRDVAVEALLTLGPAVLPKLHDRRGTLGVPALLTALASAGRLGDPDAAALLNELLMRKLDRASLCEALVHGAAVADPESHHLAPLATGHPDHRIRVLACRVLTQCPDAVARAAIHWSGVRPDQLPAAPVGGRVQYRR